MIVSMPTGSFLWKMYRKSSIFGERITTALGRTARWGTCPQRVHRNESKQPGFSSYDRYLNMEGGHAKVQYHKQNATTFLRGNFRGPEIRTKTGKKRCWETCLGGIGKKNLSMALPGFYRAWKFGL